MSRIINTDSTGKQRGQLTKAIAFALRQLALQTEFGDEARDLAAFIALALKTIHDGIDPSVAAWEKRGYWVKADRFRMEWAWAAPTSTRMTAAVLQGDWTAVAQLSVQTAQRLEGVQVSSHPRLGKPWLGAYARLKASD
jgi:hypothetical protein